MQCEPLLPHSASSWILSLAENLASSSFAVNLAQLVFSSVALPAKLVFPTGLVEKLMIKGWGVKILQSSQFHKCIIRECVFSTMDI